MTASHTVSHICSFIRSQLLSTVALGSPLAVICVVILVPLSVTQSIFFPDLHSQMCTHPSRSRYLRKHVHMHTYTDAHKQLSQPYSASPHLRGEFLEGTRNRIVTITGSLGATHDACTIIQHLVQQAQAKADS